MQDKQQNPMPAFLTRLVFPFAGIGSPAWFLIRVIPKPSRAAYPCMRVAAPMASTFVLWLLGLTASLAFLKRARAFVWRSRYLAAALCIAAGAITGGVLISTPQSRASAALRANDPVGEAHGASPGRVVWVHDSAATPWEGPGDGHWWEDGKTNQEIVDRMLSRTLCELSGKQSDTAAWDTLFRYFNKAHGREHAGYTPGEKIAVKINLTFCSRYPDFTCVDSTTYTLTSKLDSRRSTTTGPRACSAPRIR
ncbi:MAG: hypothetical protein GF418_16420 [Chitinivibrionales bacterium]|nr:hypothetical protein [Chitinivibrionales bacterium]MBD3397207.1 hypothetical protein [Chitinivibrionales bacterium]